MYIVVIAWLYVVMMVSFLQPTVFRGLITFIGAGVLPLALLLFLVGTPQRRRNKAAFKQSEEEEIEEPKIQELAKGEADVRNDVKSSDRSNAVGTSPVENKPPK